MILFMLDCTTSASTGHFLPAAQFRPFMIQHYKFVKWIRYSSLPTCISFLAEILDLRMDSRASIIYRASNGRTMIGESDLDVGILRITHSFFTEYVRCLFTHAHTTAAPFHPHSC